MTEEKRTKKKAEKSGEPKEKKKAEPSKGEPQQLTFSMKAVEKKPSRRYKKGSKYDPLMKAFVDGSEDLVKVDVPGVDPSYLRTQLGKRMDLYPGVKVSVISGDLFLEKLKAEPPTPPA